MSKPPRRSAQRPPRKTEQTDVKVTPCLWFNGEAEEAANFYVSLLPDSKIEIVQRNTIDGPGGTVLVVELTR